MKVLVIGSLNMDVLIPVNPYPKPGETVVGGTIQYNPGGKGANQALAAARLGADVTILGMVGNDAYGDKLRHILQSDGVETGLLQTHGGSSGLAFVHLERDGTNRIILSPGANEAFLPDKVKPFTNLITSADAVLVQLEIPIETVEMVVDVAMSAAVPVFLDPAPVRTDLFNRIRVMDWITPNEHEAELLTGQAVSDAKTARIAAAKLQLLGARRVLLKVGDAGAYVADENGFFYQPGFQVNSVDTTAAGDAFSAAFVVDYLKSQSIHSAVRTACAVGALTTTKIGAQISLPYREEVFTFLESTGDSVQTLHFGGGA